MVEKKKKRDKFLDDYGASCRSRGSPQRSLGHRIEGGVLSVHEHSELGYLVVSVIVGDARWKG